MDKLDSRDNQIIKFIKAVRGRVRFIGIVQHMMFFLDAGFAVSILIAVFSMFVPFYYYMHAIVAVMGLALVAGIIAGIVKTPSMERAALLADSRGCREKFITAYSMLGEETVFSSLQKQDAVSEIEQYDIKKKFKLPLSVRSAGIFVGLAIIFLVSSMFNTPARTQAERNHKISQEADETIAEIEKIEKKLEETKKIPEEDMKAIKEQLKQAKKELEEASSFEDIKKAQDRTMLKLGEAARSENTELNRTLSEASEQMRKQQNKDITELMEKTKEALKKAETGSSRDKAEASELLSELAEKMGDAALSEAAKQYEMSAKEESDTKNAQTAVKNAEDAGNEQYAKNSSQNSENQSEGSGDNSQNGSSEGNGQNSGNQSGSSQGTGSQNGEGSQGGEGNNHRNNAGSGWATGSGEGAEGTAGKKENVTIPDGSLGDDENLTGKNNGNENVKTGQSDESVTWTGNKTDYDKVSGEYKERAYEKVSSSGYPESMKKIIRNYFDGLN